MAQPADSKSASFEGSTPSAGSLVYRLSRLPTATKFTKVRMKIHATAARCTF